MSCRPRFLFPGSLQHRTRPSSIQQYSPHQLLNSRNMASRRLVFSSSRAFFSCTRSFSQSSRLVSNPAEQRLHTNVEEHRKTQTEKPLNPRVPHNSSALKSDIPEVGADKAPPEMLSSVEEGQAQKSGSDLNVGEIEGGSFRVEPLRRTGEDPQTTRARLLCSFSCICRPAIACPSC
jgi:hypothetical protein